MNFGSLEIFVYIRTCRSGGHHSLDISIEHDESIIADDISRCFSKYIGFFRQNIDNLLVSFEIEIEDRKVDLLILDLKNQISYLKNRIEIEKVRSNLVIDELKLEIVNSRSIYNQIILISSKFSVLTNCDRIGSLTFLEKMLR